MPSILWAVLFIWGATPVFGFVFHWNPVLGTGVHALLIVSLSAIGLVLCAFNYAKVVLNIWFLLFLFLYSFYFFSTIFVFEYSDRVLVVTKYLVFLVPPLSICALASFFSVEERVAIFCSALTVSGLVMSVAVLYTGPSSDGRFGDLANFHPNVVSYYLSISFIAALYSKNLYFIARVLFCLLMSICLFLLLSKTTLISLMASFAITYFVISEGIRDKLKIIAFSVVGVSLSFFAMMIFYWDYFLRYFTIGDGKLLFTLTGRTVIWDKLFREGYLSYMGNGLGVFEELGPQPFEITIFSSHNDLINQAFSFGLFGVASWLMYYVLAFYFSKRVFLNHRTALFIVLFFYSFVRSLVESPQLGFNYPIVVLALISLSLSRCSMSGFLIEKNT